MAVFAAGPGRLLALPAQCGRSTSRPARKPTKVTALCPQTAPNSTIALEESALMASSGRRHRGLFTLALAAACGQPLPGFAKEAWNGCFRRVYDAAHLAAHPGQTVKSIAVSMTPGNGHWIANAQLTVTLRGKKTKYYSAGGVCEANAAGIYCSMEEDAGSFMLARWVAGVKLVNITNIRVDPHLGPEDYGPFLRNSEDGTFLLPPAQPVRASDD